MNDNKDESAPPRKPLDRDPQPPPRDAISSVQGRVLDPGTALIVGDVIPRPTVYVGRGWSSRSPSTSPVRSAC